MKSRIRLFTSGLILLCFLTSVITASAQGQGKEKPISAKEAAQYAGQVKTVMGIVASTKYATRSKGQPTFINLGQPYPNQVFTVLIWGSDRSKFDQPPEWFYKDKTIYVTGLIESYRGKAEIVVKNPLQIHIYEKE